jgi:hypothetical protein
MPARHRDGTLSTTEIYSGRLPLTTQRFDPHAFEPIDGCSLVTYATVCRALVRAPGGAARQLDAVLAQHALPATAWASIQAGWSKRIAEDPYVHDAFRRLYLKEGDPL